MKKYLANLCFVLLSGLCLPYAADARICFLPGGCHAAATDPECGTNGYKSLETCEGTIGAHERCEIGAHACYYPECMYRDTYDCEKKTGATKCALDANNCAYEMTPSELCISLGYKETTDLSTGVGANCYDCDPCDYVNTMYKCTESLKIGFTLVNGECTPGGYKDPNCWTCKVHYYDCEEISPNENYTIVGDSCVACKEAVTYNYEGTGCTKDTFNSEAAKSSDESSGDTVCTSCKQNASYTNFGNECGVTNSVSTTKYLCSDPCYDSGYTISDISDYEHCYDCEKCPTGSKYKCETQKTSMDDGYGIVDGVCKYTNCESLVDENGRLLPEHPCYDTGAYLCDNTQQGVNEVDCDICGDTKFYEKCEDKDECTMDSESHGSYNCITSESSAVAAGAYIPSVTGYLGEKCETNAGVARYWYLDCDSLTKISNGTSVTCGGSNFTVSGNSLYGLVSGSSGNCTGTEAATCGGVSYYNSSDCEGCTVDESADDTTDGCLETTGSIPQGYYEVGDKCSGSATAGEVSVTYTVKYYHSCNSEVNDCMNGTPKAKGKVACTDNQAPADENAVECGGLKYYSQCMSECNYDFTESTCTKLGGTSFVEKCNSSHNGTCDGESSYLDFCNNTLCNGNTSGKTILSSCNGTLSNCCVESGTVYGTCSN